MKKERLKRDRTGGICVILAALIFFLFTFALKDVRAEVLKDDQSEGIILPGDDPFLTAEGDEVSGTLLKNGIFYQASFSPSDGLMIRIENHSGKALRMKASEDFLICLRTSHRTEYMTASDLLFIWNGKDPAGTVLADGESMVMYGNIRIAAEEVPASVLLIGLSMSVRGSARMKTFSALIPMN